ncbi:BACON domain-containing protein [Desulfatirhabdium butyrativorans]|uniref:BACON domain-containing protein n=1 Tax=Desulfatirhabdium butyrativorans TaxID=340467 RepID=UPI00042A78DA|nr:BACON domain-containing carbohydrate-binding protein [Desulfatirhabdium butyrativorans]
MRKSCAIPFTLFFLVIFPSLASADLVIPVLSVSPLSQAVGYQSSHLSFAVYNTGSGTLNWSAEVQQDINWVHIDSGAAGSGSGSIQLSVDAYNGTAPRSCSLTVSSQGAMGSPKTLTITQYGLNSPVLTASSRYIHTSGSGGNASLTIFNSGYGRIEWQAAVTEGSDWIQLSSSNGTNTGELTCTVLPTNTTDKRSGIIEVTGKAYADNGDPVEIIQSSMNIEMAQDGSTYTLVVSPTSLPITQQGQKAKFEVSFNTTDPIPFYNWSAEVISGKDWLSISSSPSGIGAGSFECSATANTGVSSRVGTVQVTSAGAAKSPQTITIQQAGSGQYDIIGADPGLIHVMLSKTKTVQLAVNNSNQHGDQPLHEWLLSEAMKSNTLSPVYVITPLGVVDSAYIIDHLSQYTYPFFDASGITGLGLWKMADLGLDAEDMFIYAYAYQKTNGQIVIDNIVSIHVTE